MRLRRFISKVVTNFIPCKSWRNIVRNFIQYQDVWFLRKLYYRRVPYQYIVSLGCHCFSANALRLAHLRSFAAPFDWICGGDINTRIKYLENQFQDFFNHDDFVYNAPGNYANKHTGFVHPHDFPKNADFDAVFPDCAAKYERRARRLVRILQTNSRILLVYTGKDQDKNDIQKLLDMLDRCYCAKCDILFFEMRSNIRRCTIRRQGTRVWYGTVPTFDNWSDINRKKATRMAVGALAKFRLSRAWAGMLF